MDAKISAACTSIRNEVDLKVDNINTALQYKISAADLKIDGLTKANEALQNTINNMDRYRRLCDLIIDGIPIIDETKDLNQVIIKLAQCLNLNFSLSEIVNCFRLKAGKKKLVPSILIKFKSKEIRDAFLANYWKDGPKLMLSDLFNNLNINNRIYLNEHIGPDTRLIVAGCAALKKSKAIINYRTRNGVVYCKFLADGSFIRVSSLSDLQSPATVVNNNAGSAATR